jgi:hypothetical protein
MVSLMLELMNMMVRGKGMMADDCNYRQRDSHCA